mmetsp:Transcript_68044/g.149381  ORF Transcript_68044/g.149381 Transcript_68044/m.149381 type:complete len:90 (-) Transcript_68044:178-447(-)
MFVNWPASSRTWILEFVGQLQLLWATLGRELLGMLMHYWLHPNWMTMMMFGSMQQWLLECSEQPLRLRGVAQTAVAGNTCLLCLHSYHS